MDELKNINVQEHKLMILKINIKKYRITYIIFVK